MTPTLENTLRGLQHLDNEPYKERTSAALVRLAHKLPLAPCHPCPIQPSHIEKCVTLFIDLLFPHRGLYRGASMEERTLLLGNTLHEKLSILVNKATGCSAKIGDEIVTSLFEYLPALFELLLKDAEAIYERDPAAFSLDEIIVAYPGFFAICAHRLAHQLFLAQVPLLPRMISEFAHGRTGIDIHPGAHIGESFAIDHGTGVVVGETTVIGKCCILYQGVTLGALSVKKEKAHLKRHPTIGDNVVVYSHASVLGGNTLVGDHSVIGANITVTESIPPHSKIVENKLPISHKY
jgi:serine O-acetyltransferase